MDLSCLPGVFLFNVLKTMDASDPRSLGVLFVGCFFVGYFFQGGAFCNNVLQLYLLYAHDDGGSTSSSDSLKYRNHHRRVPWTVIKPVALLSLVGRPGLLPSR
jgi:hypothetical protein